MAPVAHALRRTAHTARLVWPGALLCATIALAAQFISSHYGAPAMLMALLLGLALQSATVGAEKLTSGVAFSARQLLRLGVGLLGARISIGVFTSLGADAILLVVASIVATVGASLLTARLFGASWSMAVLTGGAVSICGASAAIAIAAALPPRANAERDLAFTVFAVTVLSTLAMVAYPILGAVIGLDDRALALFLGGSIHDVAQVVGAGFSVSEQVGEKATTLKLIRVAMLAPFVVVLVLAMTALGLADGDGDQRPAFVPWFIVVFAALATISSLGVLGDGLRNAIWELSRWLLLAAIVGVGLKTDLSGLFSLPRGLAAFVLAQTAFLGLFILSWLHIV